MSSFFFHYSVCRRVGYREREPHHWLVFRPCPARYATIGSVEQNDKIDRPANVLVKEGGRPLHTVLTYVRDNMQAILQIAGPTGNIACHEFPGDTATSQFASIVGPQDAATPRIDIRGYRDFDASALCEDQSRQHAGTLEVRHTIWASSCSRLPPFPELGKKNRSGFRLVEPTAAEDTRVTNC